MIVSRPDIVLPVMVFQSHEELERYYARRLDEARTALENQSHLTRLWLSSHAAARCDAIRMSRSQIGSLPFTQKKKNAVACDANARDARGRGCTSM